MARVRAARGEGGLAWDRKITDLWDTAGQYRGLGAQHRDMEQKNRSIDTKTSRAILNPLQIRQEIACELRTTLATELILATAMNELRTESANDCAQNSAL